MPSRRKKSYHRIVDIMTTLLKRSWTGYWRTQDLLNRSWGPVILDTVDVPVVMLLGNVNEGCIGLLPTKGRQE
uniref:Uncharacterized protein n=1 Tax=Vespula pensylvanica TaxID=30213 RepID=A0A834PA56_VESPE|nr:hypothetical protein H0235_002454 [Vespula pensylvanica]